MTFKEAVQTTLAVLAIPIVLGSLVGATVLAQNYDTLSQRIVQDGQSQRRLVKSRKEGTVLYFSASGNYYNCRLVDEDSDGIVDFYRAEPFSSKPLQRLRIERAPTFEEQKIFDRALFP